MAIGYTGNQPLIHSDPDCFMLRGDPREIPESKALKWDYGYCLECPDP